MIKIAKELHKIANILDANGFCEEAAQIDSIILSLAADGRKFAITVNHKVSVGKADYAKFDEPPTKTHKSVTTTVIVNPATDEKVDESSILLSQTFKSKDLDQARKMSESTINQAKAKYVPASSVEKIEYIPV